MSEALTLMAFPMPGGAQSGPTRTAMPITFRRAHISALGPEFATAEGPMFALNAMGAHYLVLGAMGPVYDLVFPAAEEGGHAHG